MLLMGEHGKPGSCRMVICTHKEVFSTLSGGRSMKHGFYLVWANTLSAHNQIQRYAGGGSMDGAHEE